MKKSVVTQDLEDWVPLLAWLEEKEFGRSTRKLDTLSQTA
jgi:hypothetical protein